MPEWVAGGRGRIRLTSFRRVKEGAMDGIGFEDLMWIRRLGTHPVKRAELSATVRDRLERIARGQE